MLSSVARSDDVTVCFRSYVCAFGVAVTVVCEHDEILSTMFVRLTRVTRFAVLGQSRSSYERVRVGHCMCVRKE
jgi:hypothetical protein